MPTFKLTAKSDLSCGKIKKGTTIICTVPKGQHIMPPHVHAAVLNSLGINLGNTGAAQPGAWECVKQYY